jgi:SAM-dependent methyltransferase
MADAQPVKDIQKLMWSLGDYRELARPFEPAAVALVEACGVGPGMEVLDVAAGTGNLALAAARRGARVVASDLTPRMVELGRERSAAEGLDIEWREADAEDLPFDDGRFQVVASTFGAQFAPPPPGRGRRAGPGGQARRHPGPGQLDPPGLPRAPDRHRRRLRAATAWGDPSPLAWGEPVVVRERLAGLAGSVEVQPRMVPTRFASRQAARAFQERYNGPLIALRNTLPPERYSALMTQFDELVDQFNRATDGTVAIEVEYLLVVARKP